MNKQYSRLKQINLPIVGKTKDDLQNIIKKRISFRDFTGKPISLEILSKILFYSSGANRPNPFENDNPFRFYPSAGAKYPLEIYILVMSGKDIKSGLYHYNPVMNYLDILSQEIKKEEIEAIWIKKHWCFKNSSALILLTSTFHRTTDKYGARGVMFPYIEAGHLAQNVYLMATSLNVGCCAIGMLREKYVIKLLDINPREEYPIYYLAIGN